MLSSILLSTSERIKARLVLTPARTPCEPSVVGFTGLLSGSLSKLRKQAFYVHNILFAKAHCANDNNQSYCGEVALTISLTSSTTNDMTFIVLTDIQGLTGAVICDKAQRMRNNAFCRTLLRWKLR